MALKRLQIEYKQIQKEPNYFYSIELDKKDVYTWNVLLIGPPESIFEGGIFKCQFKFPPTYPNKPPEFRFLDKIFHPNIFPDGRVCISILHEGADQFGYEHISERWGPSHGVNSIIMSVMLMLTNPNFESPANIDASVMWRNEFDKYKKIVYQFIAKSQS